MQQNAGPLPALKRRNVLHLLVTRKRTRCLPVVLHLLDGQIAWFNQHRAEFLREVEEIITENLSDIEEHNQDAKASKALLPRLHGTHLQIAYSTESSSGTAASYSLVQGGKSVPMASFRLLIWVFPLDAGRPYAALPIDHDDAAVI